MDPSQKQMLYESKKKSTGVAYLFYLLFGCHYAYLGQWGMQILFWITGYGLGVWALIDLFRIPGMVRAYNSRAMLECNLMFEPQAPNVVVQVRGAPSQAGKLHVTASAAPAGNDAPPAASQTPPPAEAAQTGPQMPQPEQKEATPPVVVEDVVPFRAPSGALRGYMFEGIVYATREQAEAEKSEKEARVVDGVLYDTREQADAARAEKAEIAARTVDGVLYATCEQADAARAELAEIAACTVDGIRYATRAQADVARAELAEIAACTVEGVRYATREQADEVRADLAELDACTVEGIRYATREQADEVRADLAELDACTVEGIRYATREQADEVRADLERYDRTVNGRLYQTREMAEAARAEKKTALVPAPATPTAPAVQPPQRAAAEEKKPVSPAGIAAVIVVLAIVAYGLYSSSKKETSRPYVPSQRPSASQNVRSPAPRPAPPRPASSPRSGAPSIDWSSIYAQGYNHTGSGNPLHNDAGESLGISLPPDKRVDLLAQKRLGGNLYYKVRYNDGGRTVTGWSRADWMKTLPTGRSIPDETPSYTPPPAVRAPETPSYHQPEPEAPQVPKLTGDRPLTRGDARKGYVTALGLNVRADHDNTSRVIAQAEQGASLSIIDTWQDYTSEYPWYKIDDLPGDYGWVYGKYVALASAQQIGTVTIKSGYLNVRRDHNKTSEAWARVEKGSRWNVVETWMSKDVPYPWYRIVDSNGAGGWVSGRYFTIDGQRANEGWRMSDEEYREFMQHSDFAAADNQMAEVWAQIRQEASGPRYQELLNGQKAWIARRRDRMATNIYNQSGPYGETKRECYRRATQQRTQELLGALKKLRGY